MKSTLVKIGLIAILALALCIPVGMIQGLVAERQARRDEAVAGIAEGWGKRQALAGPYLAIPYERKWTTIAHEVVDGKTRERRTEHTESQILRRPVERMEWSVDASISEKARGIYKARLYGAKLNGAGLFILPDRADLEDGTSRYKWGTPRIVIGISDPNGIRAVAPLSIGERSYAFAAGAGDTAVQGGLHAPIHDAPPTGAKLPFSFSIELGGSEFFAIAPLGADTTLAMRADWPHPSFQGRFLPARHEIGAAGFEASWKVSRFAGQGAEREARCGWPCAAMNDQIAVSFVEPAGLYQRLERASKYGFLFIGLTFAAFVLFELLRRLAIHPVQYTLVGLALAMFFLLLTALSEHIAFSTAYAVATTACVGLITGYLVRVLRSARAGLAFGAGLAALYGVLYAVLRAEDYSLLGGTLLLFALLAALMIATRHVEWYSLGAARQAQPG